MADRQWDRVPENADNVDAEFDPSPRFVHMLSSIQLSVASCLYHRKSIEYARPIQTLALPHIWCGLRVKDVVVRAPPKSGKTFTYLVDLARRFRSPSSRADDGPSAIIILPETEKCKKVYEDLMELKDICHLKLEASLIICPTALSELGSPMPNVVVSTPGFVSCLGSARHLQSLELLVLDEVDLLLSPDFEGDLKSVKLLLDSIPKSCQCLVYSANPRAEVKQLKNLVLRNPYVLTLTEDGQLKAEIYPYNFENYHIWCEECERPYYLQYYVGFHDKVIVFTNSDETSYMLESFLEKAEYRVQVLSAVLTKEVCMDQIQVFNDADSGVLVVTDRQQSAARQPAGRRKGSKRVSKQNWDLGCVYFKNVYTVYHFDIPGDADAYECRLLSIARLAIEIKKSLIMVTPLNKGIFDGIRFSLGEDGNLNTRVFSKPWWLPNPTWGKHEHPGFNYTIEKLLWNGLGIRVDINKDRSITAPGGTASSCSTPAAEFTIQACVEQMEQIPEIISDSDLFIKGLQLFKDPTNRELFILAKRADLRLKFIKDSAAAY